MPTGWSCETCGARGPVGRALQHKPGYSCSGQSNNYYGGYSPQVQLAQNLLMPVFQAAGQQMAEALMKLFRGRTPEEKAQRAYEKNQKLLKKVRNQLDDTRKDFEKELLKDMRAQQVVVARELEKRFVRSQAMTAIRQANCAAHTSLLATRQSLNALEDTRTGAEFSEGNMADCPPIQYEMEEVTPQQRVAFQEVFYRMVKEKSDSLKVRIDSLQKVKVEITQMVADQKAATGKLETTVEVLKKQPEPQADSLLAAALRELKKAQELQAEAEAQEAALREDLEKKEAFLETLELLRSTYDQPAAQKPKS